MKIAYGSDFHFEFHDEQKMISIIDSWVFDIDTDLLVIAGDLDVSAKRIMYAIKIINNTHDIPILYVPGNHDYYGSSFYFENMDFQKFGLHDERYDLLINDCVKKDNITFCGCMGNIDGSWEEITMWKHGALNDFHQISDFHDHVMYGKSEYKTLDENMSKTVGKLIVVTHTMPSPACVSERFKGDYLNPCFANDWSDLILNHRPMIWICGHTHDEIDMWIDNTKVVANPYGYPHENLKWEWKYINA